MDTEETLRSLNELKSDLNSIIKELKKKKYHKEPIELEVQEVLDKPVEMPEDYLKDMHNES